MGSAEDAFSALSRFLMYGMEQPAPSRAGRQMHQRPQNAGQSRPEGAISAVVGALGIHRPVNQKGTPHDGIAVHESPIAAVLTVIAVVAHGEILFGRDHDFVALNIFPDLSLPFVDRVL